jgi:hypothetical protein
VKYLLVTIAALAAFTAGMSGALAQTPGVGGGPPPAPEADAEPEPAPGSYAEPENVDVDTEASVATEPERPLRKGFLGGAAFGLGSVNMSCTGQGCGHFAGIGLSLDAGYAFSPRWAVVGDLWFTGGVEGQLAAQLVSFSINARFWVLPRFWVQAGLGVTGYDLYREGGSGAAVSASGSGLLLGAGVDLWRGFKGHIVVDLRAKLGLLSVEDEDNLLGDRSGDPVDARQTTAMVNVSWY